MRIVDIHDYRNDHLAIGVDGKMVSLTRVRKGNLKTLPLSSFRILTSYRVSFQGVQTVRFSICLQSLCLRRRTSTSPNSNVC